MSKNNTFLDKDITEFVWEFIHNLLEIYKIISNRDGLHSKTLSR